MRPPPLAELYDALRADGFAIGVDDHVRLNRLLEREATWTLDTLRTAIAALVVTDPDERDTFDACWRRWVQTVEPSAGVEIVRPLSNTAKSSSTRRRRFANRVIEVVIVAIVAAFFAVGSRSDVSWRESAPRLEPSTEVPDSADPSPVNVPASNARPSVSVPARNVLSEDELFTATGTPQDIRPRVNGPRSHVPPQVNVADPGGLWRFSTIDITDVGVALGTLVLVAAIATGLRRAKSRRRFLTGPWCYVLGVPEPAKSVLPRSAIEDSAADL